MADTLWPWSKNGDRKEERQVSMQGWGPGCCALGLKEHFSSIVNPQTQSFLFYIFCLLGLISFALNIKTQNFSLRTC